MTRYERGFLTKCAEHGVDGRILLEKRALLEEMILRATPEGRAALKYELGLALGNRTGKYRGAPSSRVWLTGPRTPSEYWDLWDKGGTYARRKALHDAKYGGGAVAKTPSAQPSAPGTPGTPGTPEAVASAARGRRR